MTFKAGRVCAALLGMGLVASCGGGGGGTVTNATWRLWSESSTTFSEHTIMGSGGGGRMDNTVLCSFDKQANLLNFALVDAGYDEFDQVARRRSVLEVEATTDGSVCNVEVKEAPLGAGSIEPTYTDRCGVNGGCEISFQVQDGGSTITGGQLRCTQMKDNPAATPLELAGSNDPATNTRLPMTFSFEKCN